MRRVIGALHMSHDNTRPIRLGVILTALGNLDTLALRYAILNLNSLQSFAEFEIIYDPTFAGAFAEKFTAARMDRDEVTSLAATALIGLEEAELQHANSVRRNFYPCDKYLLISNGAFEDGYYSSAPNHSIVLLALGNWDRFMAPPSLLEFIVSYCLLTALTAKAKGPRSHTNSKGCMFDFNNTLENARLHLLTGHICHECSAHIEKNAPGTLDQLRKLVGGRWLGDPEDALSAHATLNRLGFKPFRTTGTQPTFAEQALDILRSKFVEETLRFGFAFLLLFLVFYFGFNK